MTKSYEALSEMSDPKYLTLKDIKAKHLLDEMKKNEGYLGELSAEEWIDGYLQSLNYCVANPTRMSNEELKKDAWDNLSREEYNQWLLEFENENNKREI